MTEKVKVKVNLVDLIDKPAWKSILIDLVDNEKMDPWEIDLIYLTKAYLEKIQTLSEKNLRVPANAILACAILLRFKARYLRFTDFFKEEEEINIFEAYPELSDLKDAIPVLKAPLRVKQGKVSLDNLVTVIEELMNQTKTGKNALQRIKPVMEVDFNIRLTEADIEKNMEGFLENVKLNADSQGMTMFSHMTKGKSIYDIVVSFLYLIYLANVQKLLIWQEIFFDSEIFIALPGSQIVIPERSFDWENE